MNVMPTLMFCISNVSAHSNWGYTGATGKLKIIITSMSRVLRKPAFCIFENKDTDQLRGNRPLFSLHE